MIGIRPTAWVFAAIAALMLPAPPASAQQATARAPVIDMHLHALPLDPNMKSICAPYRVMPSASSGAEAREAMKRFVDEPDCVGEPLWAPENDEALMRQTLAVMEKHNVIGLTSGTDALLARWKQAAPDRILYGLGDVGSIGRLTDPETLVKIRRLHAEGKLAAIAEIGPQYVGIAPDDPVLAPVWALAEELDLPVGIHVGPGPPGAPYLFAPKYRARLHSPLAIEEVVLKHPKLRVYLMHAAWPMLDDLLAVLYTHPQVHIDVSVIVYALPRKEFYRYLKSIVDAGFGDRVMFGSDMMNAAQSLEIAIGVIKDAPFLSEEQKRDILYDNAARFLRLDEATIRRHHAM